MEVPEFEKILPFLSSSLPLFFLFLVVIISFYIVERGQSAIHHNFLCYNNLNDGMSRVGADIDRR